MNIDIYIIFMNAYTHRIAYKKLEQISKGHNKS